MATGRLPKRATSQPASGREVIRPTGRPSRTPPSAALSRCRCCWILGIREAQEEKHKPARKKNALTAMRFNRWGGRGRAMAPKVAFFAESRSLARCLQVPLLEDDHMMGHMAGYHEADGKRVQRSFADGAHETQLFVGERVEQVLGGFANGPELFEQVFPAAVGGAVVETPLILVPARKRGGVHPGETQGAVCKDSFGVDDMLQHLPDGPFPFGVTIIVFFSRNTLHDPPELFRVLPDGFAKIVVFDQVDIALIKIGGDDLGAGDHGLLRLMVMYSISYWYAIPGWSGPACPFSR